MSKFFSNSKLERPISSASRARSLSVLGSVVAATCMVVASSAFSPASAFTFTQQTDTAGSPAGQNLYNIDITSADIGETFAVDWFMSKSTINTSADLSATGTFKVTDFTNNLLSLEVKLTNTTSASFQAAITSMGFGVTPDPKATTSSTSALSLTQAGSVFKTATLQTGAQNFPGGFKNIDACISANGCSGGSINNGLQSGGHSDTYKVTIAGNFGMDYSSRKATLSSFPVKFQSSAGSFEIAGSKLRRKVPEPGTTAAFGVVALGAFSLRKRKKAALQY